MYTPKFSTKRVVGLSMATALAVSGTAVIAGSSQAATLAFKLSSTTTAVEQVMTVTAPKGYDFTDSGGLSLVDLARIDFRTSACVADKTDASVVIGAAGTVATGTGVGGLPVAETPSRIRLTTPTVLDLTNSKPTKYNVCFYSATADTQVGVAKVTVYTTPAGAGDLTLSTATGPSYGGTKITVTGQDFTKKTKVSVGGVLATGAKTSLGKTATDADSVTVITPPGTGSSLVRVVGEWGSSEEATVPFVYTSAIKVSPSGSDGAIDRLITVTGSGFQTMTWADAADYNKSAVYLVAADYDPAAFVAGFSIVPDPAGIEYSCASITVISDTELTCSLAASMAATPGGFTAIVVTVSGVATTTGAIVPADSTGFSREATYAVAAI